MKKRLLAIFLAAVIFMLCGCAAAGDGQSADSQTTDSQSATQQTAAEDSAEVAQLKRKAAKIDAKIKEIGKVILTSEDAIAAARSAYDSADANVQQYVTQLDVLVAAEQKLQQLKEQQIKHVIDLIDAIGQVTADSGAAISTAKEAYDSLPSGEKAKITNASVLTKAIQNWEALRIAEANQILAGLRMYQFPGTGIKEYFPKEMPHDQFYPTWSPQQRSFVLPYLRMQEQKAELYLVCHATGADYSHFKSITFQADGKTYSIQTTKLPEDSFSGWKSQVFTLREGDLKVLDALGNAESAAVIYTSEDGEKTVTISDAERKAIAQFADLYRALTGLF